VNEHERDKNAARRLAILRHAEEVTGNVALTCRYYGITWQAFYQWQRRLPSLTLMCDTSAPLDVRHSLELANGCHIWRCPVRVPDSSQITTVDTPISISESSANPARATGCAEIVSFTTKVPARQVREAGARGRCPRGAARGRRARGLMRSRRHGPVRTARKR
jgi:hypothetical protein